MIAEFGTGQVFWSLLWLSLAVILLYILIYVATDIIRSDDLSGAGKALWMLVILVAPYIGVLVYLVARSSMLGDRGPTPPAPDLIFSEYA